MALRTISVASPRLHFSLPITLLFHSLPGADSHVGGVCEAAFAPPLGLLRPLPLQTSIQTLQAVLRPLGAAGGHGPVPDARGPHRHQHDHPQRYPRASVSLRVLLTWRSCPFFVPFYSPVCPFGSCRMEIRLVYMFVFLDNCPWSETNACGCTFIHRQKHSWISVLPSPAFKLGFLDQVTSSRFSQMAVCLARLLFNQKSNHEYCNGTVALKCSCAFVSKWSRDKEVKPSLMRRSTDKKNLESLKKNKKKTTSVQDFLKEGGCKSNIDAYSFWQSVWLKIHVNIRIY